MVADVYYVVRPTTVVSVLNMYRLVLAGLQTFFLLLFPKRIVY